MRAYAQEALDIVGQRSGRELADDRLRLLAATRAAEIVGEAASQVPAAVRAKLRGIEFEPAISMRHKLIHGYGSLSSAILAETIKSDFPRLIAALDKILASPLPDDL